MNMEEEVFWRSPEGFKVHFFPHKMHYFFFLGLHLYEYMCLLPRVDLKAGTELHKEQVWVEISNK